jgi:hypothetical protein
MLLLTTVQTHDARRLAAWLIAVRTISQARSQRMRRVQWV